MSIQTPIRCTLFQHQYDLGGQIVHSLQKEDSCSKYSHYLETMRNKLNTNTYTNMGMGFETAVYTRSSTNTIKVDIYHEDPVNGSDGHETLEVVFE